MRMPDLACLFPRAVLQDTARYQHDVRGSPFECHDAMNNAFCRMLGSACGRAANPSFRSYRSTPREHQERNGSVPLHSHSGGAGPSSGTAPDPRNALVRSAGAIYRSDCQQSL
uniref:Uncharacterized protein n=1 Tax=Aurantimonas coralicida TaxID=182270 RepID=A0A0P0YYZ3_9HYPH|nr:hypothetical protein [Aurantimonas coralicida]